ncbi:gamma-glutamylcyclotransferase [Motiliproteus sp. SC1-56]|uniref:gamma-glutamylcyclotransferase n=1 Tax=Motiliproteus sp. SC1-56 TaxID=2799565 RepID=UPI001A8F6C17|nr:gamma-glutamylcyclotransferase [Motiliproteus sp. SC1-56]
MTSIHPRLSVHRDAVRPPLPEGDLWVFAYGSLLWNPGFDYLEHQEAHLFGYHRALCVWSHVHRGTAEAPGMVLGLDRGGSCRGRAYRVASKDRQAAADYLYAREMPTPVYRARLHPMRLADGRRIRALTFIVDHGHPQYAGRISPAQAANHVAGAEGLSGSSRDYLFNTLRHLQALGIQDPHLQAVADALPDRHQ